MNTNTFLRTRHNFFENEIHYTYLYFIVSSAVLFSVM